MQVYMEQITDLIQEEGEDLNSVSPSSPNPNPMVFSSGNKKLGLISKMDCRFERILSQESLLKD